MTYKTLIQGPPGTGKTHALMNIIENDMDQYGITPHDIVMCTFTRSAAKVYAGRIRRKNPTLTDDAFFNFRTMHSMCARLLKLKKHDFVNVSDVYRMVSTNMDDVFDDVPDVLPSDDTDEDDEDLADAIDNDKTLEFTGMISNQMLSQMIKIDNLMRICMLDDYDELYERTGISLTYYDRGLKSVQTIPYEDMIDFSDSWREFMEMHEKYDYTRILEEVYEEEICPDAIILLGDEGQDYSPLQYAIHNMWAERVRKAYIASDVNQALYRFSGADPTLILNDYFDERIELSQTYRFGENILNNSKKYLAPMRYKAEVAYMPASHKDYVSRFSGTDRLRDILTNLNQERQTLVLARTNNMVASLGKMLEKYSVKFDYLHNKKSEVARYIESYNILAALERDEEITLDDMLKLIKRMRANVQINDTTTLSGETTKKKKPILKMGVKKKLRDGTIKNDTWNKRLIERMLMKTKWDSTLMMKSLGFYDSDFLREVYPEHVEMDIKIKVGTIHRAKGMQADTVVLVCDIPYPVQKAIAESEAALDAELRVFYVGATRAKSRLVEIDDVFPVDSILRYI